MLIAGVSRDLLALIEEKGAAMVPPVRRNPLILWVLSEYVAGRLVMVADLQEEGRAA